MCMCTHKNLCIFNEGSLRRRGRQIILNFYCTSHTLLTHTLTICFSHSPSLSLVIHFSSFMTFIIIPFSVTYRLSALVSKEKFLRVFSSFLTINWWRVRRIKMIIFLFCGRRLITLIDSLIRIMKFMNK